MKKFLPSLICCAAMGACGGGGGGSSDAPIAANMPASSTSVSVQFAAVAGNTPAQCGTLLSGLGSTSVSAQLTDLRFYLTDVQLVNDQGVAVPITLAKNEWQTTSDAGSVALIDLENAQGACASEGTTAMNAVVTGLVPAGNYVKIKATVGVPEKLSHSDVMSASAPLDIMAMGWSWQSGRKFAKIELNPVGGVGSTGASAPASVATYSLHLASTNCTGPGNGADTCAQKNLAQFTLELNPSTQKIALDVAQLFKTSNLSANQNGAVGCMSSTSDLDCQAVFTQMGLDLNSGEQAAVAQSVFRAIAK
jgi:uncharacterized repeat protein (TIGR04052 family)